MKTLLKALAVIVLSLAVVGGVVFGLGDDETLVSPPEVVAERFIDALGHGRPGAARALLAESAARSASITTVTEASRGLRSRIGDLEHVKAIAQNRRRSRATVRVEIEGSRMQLALALPLVLERGEWRIEGFGGALAQSALPPTESGAR